MSSFQKATVYALAFVLLIPAVALVWAPRNGGPNISTPSISPSSPGPSDQVTVTSTVTAGAIGVKNVTLVYTIAAWHGTNATLVAKYNSTNQKATAIIPAQQVGVHVQYYIVAFDNNTNRAVNDNNGQFFGYTVIQGPASSATSTWIELGIVLAAVAAAVSVAIYSLRPRPRKQSS